MSSSGSSSTKKKLESDTAANSGPDGTPDLLPDNELNENSDRDLPTGCLFNGSYVFTIAGVTQCITLISEICGIVCVHLSASSVLMIALAFIARGYFNVLCSSILLFLHLFNVLVTYDNFPWASIKLSFYITATMISLLTSILITARHDGFLTIAAFLGYVAMFGHGWNAWFVFWELENAEQYAIWPEDRQRTSIEC